MPHETEIHTLSKNLVVAGMTKKQARFIAHAIIQPHNNHKQFYPMELMQQHILLLQKDASIMQHELTDLRNKVSQELMSLKQDIKNFVTKDDINELKCSVGIAYKSLMTWMTVFMIIIVAMIILTTLQE